MSNTLDAPVPAGVCYGVEPTWYQRLTRKLKEWSKLRLQIKIVEKKDDSNTLFHARMEFKALGYIPLDQPQEEDPNKWIQESVMELLEVFSRQGHSGYSAPFCVEYFKTLALHKPLSPLTGEDWEWVDVTEYGDPKVTCYQNKRCGAVFKQADRFDGQAYYLDAIVWKDKNGSCWTNSESRQPITFPYTPHTEYRDAPEEIEEAV